MTTSEKMEILREREDHAYEMLRTLDPTTGVCKVCLDVIGTISFLRSGLTLESVDAQLRVAHVYFLHSVQVWVGEQNGETAGIGSRGWLLWDKLSQGAGI